MSRIVTTQCDSPLCTATFRHRYRQANNVRAELVDADWTFCGRLDFCPEHGARDDG